METVKEGEIQRRRDSMYEMFEGFWRSCINPTDDLPGRKQDTNLEPFIVSTHKALSESQAGPSLTYIIG